MKSDKNNMPQLYARYLAAISMLALAGALTYFTAAIVEITEEIPDILLTVESTGKEIGPIVNEVSAIQEQIPAILKEVEETRKLVQLAIVEYTKTNQQIPRILDEVEATRKVLPAVLKTADNASSAVVVVSKEIEESRLLIPQVISEVEKTRESIPFMLDRVDRLVANAREAGKEASSGAVSGVFSGIIMAPFRFAGSVSKKVIGNDEVLKKLSDEDNKDIEKAYTELLESGHVGDKNSWSNKSSGNSGLVTLTDVTVASGKTKECRTIKIVIKDENKKSYDKSTVLCKDDSGQWE